MQPKPSRLPILGLLALGGCIFITQADIDARTDATTGQPSLGDDDTWGDDDDMAPEGWVPGRWTAVSVGVQATCAIDDQLDLQCWSTYDDPYTDWFPAIPEDLDFVGLSMGLRGGCAWDDTGETRCFGENLGGEYSQVRSYAAEPGSYDDVRCGSGICCGVLERAFTCWDGEVLDGSEWRLLDPHPEGVLDIAGHGHWCVIDGASDTIDCFTTLSTGGNEPDWADADFTALYAAQSDDMCAVTADGTMGCWGTSSGAGNGVGFLDAPPASELTYLHAHTNGSPNMCGLRGGTMQCFTVPFQTPYTPVLPEGSWTKLSLGDEGGCLLDAEDRMACWGSGAHVPHNRR